jgi:lipopolysaccharide export system permease protein
VGTLSRYILKEILKTFIPLWMGLAFFPMLAEWLATAFKLNGSASDSVLAYAYKIPFYLQLVFPIALVVATVVVFRTMNRNREIVALESLGVRYRDLLPPLVMTVILAGIPFVLISTVIAPKGMRAHYTKFSELKGSSRSDVGQVKKEKIWYRKGEKILYNVGFYDSQKKELIDVSLYEFDNDFQLNKITSAKKAQWTGKSWMLLNANILLVGKEYSQAERKIFTKLENTIFEKPNDLIRFDFNPEVLTQEELSDIIKRYRQLGINTNVWETAYYSRLSYLALALILMLIALPKTLVFRRTNNLAKDLTFITVFCLFLWIVYTLCLNLGAEGQVDPALAAWAPVVGLFVYSLFGIANLKLKGQSE